METRDFVAALHFDLVSAERNIFSGMVKFIAVSGAEGELGIACGHSPLLTAIPPGHIKVIGTDNQERFYYAEGGFLEVQPHCVTILADTVLRASEIDLEKALKAKQHAEQEFAQAPLNVNYSQASHDLLAAMAKIEVANRRRKPSNKRGTG